VDIGPGNAKMERWKDGKMERWKDGKMDVSFFVLNIENVTPQTLLK